MLKFMFSITRFRAVATAIVLTILLGCSHVTQTKPPKSTTEKPLQATQIVSTRPSTSIHLNLGNPSSATTSVANPDNYLLDKPQYVLSYNNSKGTPNWVSWQLNKSWLGTTDRQNNFRPDDTLPTDFVRITPTAYTGSGYDKGHI